MTETMVKRCKHNLDIDACAICNGDYDKYESNKTLLKEKQNNRRESVAKRKALLEYSKEVATRHNAEYTDYEIRHIIYHTATIVKSDYESLYNLAIDLSRSLGAMEWIWNYIWKDEITDIFRDGMDNTLWKRVQNIMADMPLEE